MGKGESSGKYLTWCEQELQTCSLFTSERIYLGGGEFLEQPPESLKTPTVKRNAALCVIWGFHNLSLDNGRASV
jgi:hypothetical protein